jgi:hypothetical protein
MFFIYKYVDKSCGFVDKFNYYVTENRITQAWLGKPCQKEIKKVQ